MLYLWKREAEVNPPPMECYFLKNGVLKTFTGLEMRYILCRIGHLLSASRFYTGSGFTMLYGECSETYEADFVAFTEGILDSIENGIYCDTCLFLGDFSIIGNVRY